MNESRLQDSKPLVYSAIILATVAIVFALRAMKPVMVPFVIALFLFYIFSPLTDLLKRRLRVPHGLAVTLSLICGLLVLSLLTMTVARSVETAIANFGKYRQNVELSISKLEELVRPFLPSLQEPPELSAPEGTPPGNAAGGEPRPDPSVDSASGEAPPDSPAAAKTTRRPRELLLEEARTFLAGLALELPTFFSTAALVLIFFGYLISGRRRASSPFLRKVAITVNRYLVIKVVVSLATGALVWMILRIVGLQLAFVFGMLAFALNFIPSVGSMIATLLPAPVAFSQFGLTTPMFLAILLPGCVQFVIGNVIEPLVQGEGLDLHPITVLLALMFWYSIWGIPGMFIAAPLTSVIRIFLRQTEWGQPIANLLSGRI